MLPISLLNLTQTKLAFAEFRTPNDSNIQADVMRVLTAQNKVIISSDKVIESKEISANLWVENQCYSFIFEVTEELQHGLQYILKVKRCGLNNKQAKAVNVCGVASVVAPVPSFEIDSPNHASSTPELTNSVIALSSTFLTLYDTSGVATTNIADCINSSKKLKLNAGKESIDLSPTQVARLSSNVVKIAFDSNIDIAKIKESLNEQILKAVRLEVMRNKTIVEAASNENS